MDEIIVLLKASIKDNVFSTREKKAVKQLIQSKKLSKREQDFLRSQVFDIALQHREQLSKEALINWIEATNKLTLGNQQEEGKSRAYFSPGTACQSAIINLIKNASESLKICVFTISDNDIRDEILAAHRRGVGVKILTDNDKSFDRGSDIEQLAKSGVAVKIDTTDKHMHHKFCIADKKTLLTGSYNWTRSAAERNEENIVITEENGLVKSFLGEFEKLWGKMENYK